MTRARAVECIGPSYQLSDRKAAVQRSVNMYLERGGDGEPRPLILRSAPGLVQYAVSGFGDVRGAHVVGDRRFFVAGASLVEFEADDIGQTERGVLLTSSGRVSIAHGVDQLVIVDGPNGYVYNLTTGAFSQITSPGWRGSNSVSYLDGYFLFVDPDTEQFYISAIDDGSSFDALDFSSADTQPDNIIAFSVFKREAYFFGAGSTEVWVNSGNPDFPLTRYNATPIQVGAVGPYATITAADSLIFVGQTDKGRGIVYRISGYQPVRISTQAVEESLRQSTDIESCWMWAYQVEGHEFVGVEAPGCATTWVWDAATEQWHERARFVDGAFSRLELRDIMFHRGTHYAAYRNTVGVSGSYFWGRIDPEVYVFGSEPLMRERTWPHLEGPAFDPVAYSGLEIACTTGDSGGNVTLEVSNDGGYTFGAPLLRTLGVIGRRMQRVRWLRLGSARDRVFRLRCSDPVPFNLHAATIDV